jgi:hypothetical protein
MAADEREGGRIISLCATAEPSARDLVRFAEEGTALALRLMSYGEFQAALTALDTARDVLDHAMRVRRAS